MADIELQAKIVLRQDSYEAWTTSPGKDFVLLKGEIGICEIISTDASGNHSSTMLFKIGDGSTSFENLQWASAKAADVYDWAKSETVEFVEISDIETGKKKQYLQFKTDNIVNHSIDLSSFITEAELQTIISNTAGKAGGIATLDNNGKVPQSQLPNTSAYETIIIYTIFDEETNTYIIDEDSVSLLANYDGSKTMFLYEPLGRLYIPYIGNNEFVIDVFGASIYFRVDLDTRICTVGVGEWVSLNEEGEISENKLPSTIIHGYYNESEGLFYEDKDYQNFVAGNYKKLFVDLSTGAMYSYSKGKYYAVTTIPGFVPNNVEYISDEEYENMMRDLGI